MMLREGCGSAANFGRISPETLSLEMSGCIYLFFYAHAVGLCYSASLYDLFGSSIYPQTL